MIELYNIYITTGSEDEGYVGAGGFHAKWTHRAHLWIHNGKIEKNHSIDDANINTISIISTYGAGYHENVSLRKIQMKEVYKDIKRINALDPATSELRLCKLFEECGEFSRAVNMKLGRKATTMSSDEILEEIKEEAADTIQCLLSFADSYDIGYDHFKDEFRDGSHKPDGARPESILIKINKYIGGICYRFEKNHPELIYQFNTCISKVLSLTSYYGIKESEVIAKIAVKNIKWEKVVNKRIENKEV